MEKKPIFFSDHLKKCLVVANELYKDDEDKILAQLYEIAVIKALEIAKEQGKGFVFEDDLLFEADKINNMFNMFHSDKQLKGLFLPPKDWYKLAVRVRLKELKNE
jgi:hypothetical protein